MSTDVISGDTVIRSDNPVPPEPSVVMPLPSDTRAGDAAFSPEQLGEMAEHAAENRISERDWVDQAASELRQKRRRDGDGLDPNPPLVEVRAARQDEPYTLREAQKEYSEGHRLYSASAALHNARQAIGSNRPITDDEVRRHDQNLHELQKMGVGSKPGEVDWNPMGMMTDGGREIPKLRDDQKVTTDLELTPRQAAKLTGNWREFQERAQNELVETLRGEEAARQVTEVAQQLQQQPARPAPTQRPQPQVDPVTAAQRQHLAAQQAALNLSAEQKAIVERSAEWQRWASKIPEFQSWAAFNYTKENDPARHAQVVKALQAGKQFNDVARQRFGELNEIRHSRAQRWAQAQGAQHAQYQRAAAAQREQLNRAADDNFNRFLATTYPHLDNAKGRKALQEHGKAIVRETFGIDDAQLQREWQSAMLRHPGAQRIICHAAVERMNQANRNSLRAHRARVPQPLAPSAGGFRSNDADTEIRSLQQRLEGQSGRAALMTATQLQQARRKAGRV